MVNLNSLEADEKPATPEQKLWRAVFLQAIQDTFGICTVAMSKSIVTGKQIGRAHV